MRLVRLLAIGIVACGTVGCGSKTPTDGATPYRGKLDAAVAIRDDSKRDEALAAVSQSAAEAGEADVVLAAVREIRDENASDRAAATAAGILSELGKAKEATEVANRIRDTNKRDATLLLIAKGKTAEKAAAPKMGH